MIERGTPILISKEDLLDYVSQEEIALRYIPGFRKVGESFKSRRENNPSAKVEWGSYGYLMYVDYGDIMFSESVSVIKYIQLTHNLESYQAVINKIAIDFGLVKGLDSSFSIVNVSKRKKVERKVIKPSSTTIIRIKKRPWQNNVDAKYWNQYGITLQQLELNNVSAISHVWINKNPPIEFVNNYPVYSYNYYISKVSGNFQRKIYQPLSTDGYKWTSNVDFSTVQGFNVLPKVGGNLLIITSSLKDVMCLKSIGNYYAIAPNSESSFIPDEYYNKLQQRWNKILLMFDGDKPGIEFAKLISKKYNIPYIHTPINSGSKDISDYVRDYGMEKTKDLMKKLIF